MAHLSPPIRQLLGTARIRSKCSRLITPGGSRQVTRVKTRKFIRDIFNAEDAQATVEHGVHLPLNLQVVQEKLKKLYRRSPGVAHTDFAK